MVQSLDSTLQKLRQSRDQRILILGLSKSVTELFEFILVRGLLVVLAQNFSGQGVGQPLSGAVVFLEKLKSSFWMTIPI